MQKTRSIKTWKNLSVLHTALTSTLLNTFMMEWNAKCEPGLLIQHQCLTSQMLFLVKWAQIPPGTLLDLAESLPRRVETGMATRRANSSLTMLAARAVHLFGIFGLLFANQVSSSCVTEENHSKGIQETSCVHLALTSVPVTDIPQDTGILILSFNNLKAISTSTFKGMKQLVELDLSGNALTSFKVDLPVMLIELNLANNSFKTIPDLSQLSTLTKLVLSNNHISIIPDSAFKGMKGLKVLELQGNAIHSLSEKVFNEVQKLQHLDLSCNRLSELPTYLISKLPDLQKFYLTENNLKNIPDDFFDGPDFFAYVFLDKNPWNCDCDLHYLKQWMEENDHAIYYLKEGTPALDNRSVICSDGTPLLDSPKIVCAGNGHGDVYQYTTVYFAQTTPVPATTKHPTSVATTMKIKALTTPIVTSTKQPETTTTPQVAWTTRTITTTPFKTTRTTTEQRRTTPHTTKVPTSTMYPSTTLTTTVKVEPSTLLTTSLASTQKHLVTVSNVPTSVKVPETLFTSTGIQLYTMPPAIESMAEAHGMSWLEYKILKNCCFLHLILYMLGLLLLLAQMILSAWLLIWTHTHLYLHYRALMEKTPNIRLIRYSLRAPVSEGAILLVHDKTVEANFSDHSSFGVTRMLVLEANTRKQEQIYTSAIL